MRAPALEVLTELNARMLAAKDRAARLQLLTDAALTLTAAGHAAVRLREGSGTLRVSACSGAGIERPAAQLALPIQARGETLGTLSLYAPAQHAFDAHDEAIALLLSQMAAHALLTCELEALAITDSHTLAYNRRYLLPRLREELDRATRHGEALSVLLVDLDHFKRVNDEHGHAVGDAVLRAFADTVRQQVRSIDVLVRRGGEEFVLILPATPEDCAHLVAERLRECMADHPLDLRPGVRVTQTISIGVATWDGRESAEALEERADLAMYEAKQRGRNRVVPSRHPAPLLPEGAGVLAAAPSG